MPEEERKQQTRRKRSRSPVHRSRSRSKERGQGRRDKNKKVNCNYVIVSNIPYDVKWKDLKDIFQKEVGDVTYVDMFTDGEGKSTGTGMVEFKDVKTANKALEKMHRYEIRDRRIVVREEKERDRRIQKDGPRVNTGPGLMGVPASLMGNMGGRGMMGNMGGQGLMGSMPASLMGDMSPMGMGGGMNMNPGMLEGMGGMGGMSGMGMMGQMGGQIPDLMMSNERELREGRNRRVNDMASGMMSGGSMTGMMGNVGGMTEHTSGGDPAHKIMETLGIEEPLTDTLFVYNLDYKVTSKKLRDVFGLAGNVVKTEVKTDKDGTSRGMAHVQFEHPVEAMQAISMFNGQNLYERAMRVKLDTSDAFKIREKEVQLPSGLDSVGLGFGRGGKPLGNIAKLSKSGELTTMIGGMPGSQTGNMAGLGSGMGGLGGTGLSNMSNLSGLRGMGGATGMGGMSSREGITNLGGGVSSMSSMSSSMAGMGGASMGGMGGASMGGMGGASMGGMGGGTMSGMGGSSMSGMGAGSMSGMGSGGGMGSGNMESVMGAGMSGLNRMGSGMTSGLGAGMSSGLGHSLEMGSNLGSGRSDMSASLGFGGMGLGDGFTGSTASSLMSSSAQQRRMGLSAMSLTNRDTRRRDSKDNRQRRSLMDQQGGNVMVKVKNIPLSWTWKELSERFQDVGDVKFAEIKIEDGRSAGWGLVKFATPECAQRAINIFHQSHIDGREIEVYLY